MSLEANVITREKPGALLVPADAVQGTSLFLVEGGRLKKRAVEIGIRGTRAVEVLSGVTESDRVVSPAVTGLADRQRVRAVNRPEPSP
jgi:multidrug efflux pump subunit AcrA (membrane-fusion protein)